MSEIATLTIQPKPQLFRIIAEAMGAYFDMRSVPQAEALKLQLVAEEIFGYCLATLARHERRSDITFRFHETDTTLTVMLEYIGPPGELDAALRRDGHIERTSFEALGLSIARQFADSISCGYWFTQDMNRYSIVHQRGKVRPA